MPANLILPQPASRTLARKSVVTALNKQTAETWIPCNIKKRVCCNYVPATNAGDSLQATCECGYSQDEHAKTRRHSSVTWSIERNTVLAKTDAYGQIQFSGVGQRIGQYARVDHKTDMDVMMSLLKGCWNMEAPNLLISVTGGAKNFKMRPRLKEMFRQGLMKAAKSTGAWIITGGMHAGVMKQVGDAVHDNLVAHGSKAGLVAIGIATWGCVKGKELLVKDGGCWPAEYRDDPDNDGKRHSCLDPNHSHYILVDDGTQFVYGGEIEFRARLEAYVSQKYRDNDSDKIPTVSVVLQGGPGTLHTVHSSIMAGTPTVIVEGSGRAADILAHAYARSEDASEQGSLWENVKAMIKREFPNEKPESHDKMVTSVKECLAKRDHMTVFRMDSSDSAREIDLVILQALLKVNKGETGFEKQLKLALTWNRIDIAKGEILTEDAEWQPSRLEELMETAILNNRVDFVKLFIESGISFREFLTDDRILMFYQKTSEMEKYLKDKQRTLQSCTKQDVSHILVKRLGDSVTVICRKGGSDASDQLLLLFFWAILRHNLDLAKLFWEEGKEGIAAALLAQKLLQDIDEQIDDPAEHVKLLKHMAYFESLAVGVLTECYEEDERKAQLLLCRVLPNFGNKTVLRLAAEAGNKLFLASVACQSLLNRIWMGKMALTNGRRQVICSLFLPPLLFWLVSFRDDAWDDIGSSKCEKLRDGGTEGQSMGSRSNSIEEAANSCGKTEIVQDKGTCCQKIGAFFYAPVVIFTANCVSYLAFLGLFSVILLTDFHRGFTKKEYLLDFWVATLILEEIRQVIETGLWSYLKDNWNILDVLIMSLFVAGFTLRLVPSSDCPQCLDSARIVLALDLMLFYLRALHIFSVHRQLGPKLVMIQNMMVDMSYFIIILMVFVLAYGIALQAILYPNSPLKLSLIGDIFKKAYFQIYGELFLDELEGTLACEATPTANSVLPRCPENTAFVPSTLLAIYILFTNVLMLNLLIAMFSYTFNKIQTNTDEHWFFQRYFLIKEYHDRPPLAPPVIVIYHLYLMFRCFFSTWVSWGTNTDFQMTYADSLNKELILWENVNADEYVRRTQAGVQQSLERRVKETQDRVDAIARKLDAMTEMMCSWNAPH